MTKRFGFTLAEVLITLGIIGVVAAMTMPTLMNSTQGAQYKTAFKKALSALSQAVTLNMALDDWNFADVTTGTGVGESDQTVRKILTTRMNVVKDEDTVPAAYTSLEALNNKLTNETSKSDETIATTVDRYIYFADGIMFAYSTNEAPCTSTSICEGFIDVNGDKGPNKIVTCDGTFTAGTDAKDAVTCAEGDTDCTPSAAQAAKEASCSGVSNPTDIYPVLFYDQTVVPRSAAAKAVLYGK